jgi:hypothetical protein
MTEIPGSDITAEAILLEIEKHKVLEKIIEELSKIIEEKFHGLEFRKN